MLSQVGLARRQDAAERGPQHLLALVHGRHEDVDRVAERIDAALLRHEPAAVERLGLGGGIARPQTYVQAHGVDRGMHLREVQRDADDPPGQGMPADRDDRESPRQIVDAAGENGQREGDVAQLTTAPAGRPGEPEREREGRGGKPRPRSFHGDDHGDREQPEPAEPHGPRRHFGSRRGDRIRQDDRQDTGIRILMPRQQRFRRGLSSSTVIRVLPHPFGAA